MAGQAEGRRARRAGRGRRGGERGASFVEFALIFPFLAVLVFGVIDLGRAWQLQNRLSNAAREAAASVESTPRNIDTGCDGRLNATDRASGEDPDLRNHAGYSVDVVELTPGGDQPVSPRCGADNNLDRGDTARVTVTADFDIITPIIGGITGDPIEMAKSVDVVVQGQ